jgi:hypothetical protein
MAGSHSADVAEAAVICSANYVIGRRLISDFPCKTAWRFPRRLYGHVDRGTKTGCV